MTDSAGRRRPSGAGPVLLVSSAGGHFTELELTADRLGIAARERHWVVPRTPQTETALAGASVTWMPRVDARQLGRAVGNVGVAMALHRRLRPRLVVSAGAAQAVPHLLAAAAHGTPVEYHESVARVDGPSLTGRIAAHLRGASLLAPVEGWGGRWSHEPDLFTGFEVSAGPPRPVTTALLALGTEQFGFPRAVELVRGVLADDAVTWQVGNTGAEIGGLQLDRWLAADALVEAMVTSSVVVVHGGAGCILTALSHGRVPVVIPRSGRLGEHVDDHQVAMATMLAERGLVVLVRPGETLEREHLERAACSLVRTRWAPAAQLQHQRAS